MPPLLMVTNIVETMSQQYNFLLIPLDAGWLDPIFCL